MIRTFAVPFTWAPPAPMLLDWFVSRGFAKPSIGYQIHEGRTRAILNVDNCDDATAVEFVLTFDGVEALK